MTSRGQEQLQPVLERDGSPLQECAYNMSEEVRGRSVAVSQDFVLMQGKIDSADRTRCEADRRGPAIKGAMRIRLPGCS
ncbi:hypothetical protein GCM10007874_15510 [Labrys miyagiensis]|uniref:Uncharacterized protein n=1 Tax=Labrys miyagiensis TaxID=346912 RepID=A0ABQ6CE92_9HYPH|nr:hypothetical protein GCM10007874_15510 [Labrys miyagiensis]